MTETDSSAPLVLLAEDDPGDANLVRAAFMDSNHACQIEHVWDGAEAMRWLTDALEGRRRLPDLLLLDINMPRKTGLEVLAEVKADARLCEIPVVMLTTSDADRDVSSAYRSGAAGYVSKPVDVDDLFGSIRSIGDYWFGVVRRPH